MSVESTPDLAVPEVRLDIREPVAGARSVPPMRDTDDIEASPSCPWCASPVRQLGYTCNPACYASWWLYYQRLAEETDEELVKLQPAEQAPLDAKDQPWYEGILAGDWSGLDDA